MVTATGTACAGDGAAGGVGRFAVQLGALSGARITAIAGSPERSLAWMYLERMKSS